MGRLDVHVEELERLFLCTEETRHTVQLVGATLQTTQRTPGPVTLIKRWIVISGKS